jgi:hypothetical protein
MLSGFLETGSIDFDALFRALNDAGYKGVITFEAFFAGIGAPALNAELTAGGGRSGTTRTRWRATPGTSWRTRSAAGFRQAQLRLGPSLLLIRESTPRRPTGRRSTIFRQISVKINQNRLCLTANVALSTNLYLGMERHHGTHH